MGCVGCGLRRGKGVELGNGYELTADAGTGHRHAVLCAASSRRGSQGFTWPAGQPGNAKPRGHLEAACALQALRSQPFEDFG